jgi:hypothetical protein
MSLVLNGTTGITNLPSINSGQIGGSRNKIINGAMVIDQRNVGASVTPASTPTYTIDRWNFQYTANSKFSTQRSTTVPSGFTNSMLVTSLSAYSVGSGDIFLVQQSIEGFNIADLAWGTASATTVTLSLWVRSSLTGTFGGALLNAAQNRSYPFTYAISSANTWEKKSITIAGDTTGTWATDNSAGIRVTFGLGGGATYSGTAGEWVAAGKYTATSAVSVVGTNAATWHVTGVQLEVGSTATEFESRSFGEELALCERYFQLVPQVGLAYAGATTTVDTCVPYRTPMRAAPTITAIAAITVTNVTAADFAQSSANITGSISVGASSAHLRLGNFSSLTTSDMYLCRNGDMNVAAAAEL